MVRIEMLKKSIGIALSMLSMVGLSVPSVEAMEISVSPPRFELDINNKTRSQSIRITNLANEPVEMEAFVRTWTTDPKTNEVQDIPSTENSFDRWIVFTPSRFTIPPRQTQTVRFVVRPKTQLAAGEHRAVIYFQEIKNSPTNREAVQAIGLVGVIVYGYAGEIKRIGTVNSVNITTNPRGTSAVFDISSNGNAHVRMRGQYAIYPASQYPGAEKTQKINDVGTRGAKLPANVVHAGVIQLSGVIPGTRRQLRLPFNKQLPPGNYVLDIKADLSGIPINKGVPFTIPATNPNTQPEKQPATNSQQ
ncbi:hypothetical protein NIES3974_38210 [Calothrix sp. NIES-3974]|nr:hypothetical protein NIES3974_38210 [Calothrix sp. NIES-3974]